MVGRRTFVLGLAAAATTLVSRAARAEAALPLNLQAQLIAKLGSFDRNFAARAGATAQALVVHKNGDAESSRVATNIGKALEGLRELGGIPARVEVAPFAGANGLAALCRTRKLAIVYLANGLDGELDAISKALAGVDILTVGAMASHADRGAVVAFDLEEGRPKIVLHLARAKAQNVAFKAELLKLARIVG